MTKNWLGECIRYARIRSGISAAQLSRGAGFSSSYISKVESGRTQPSAQAFALIAQVLDMSDHEITWLIRVLGTTKKEKSNEIAQ